MALVTEHTDEDERGVAMGGFTVFGSLGFLAGITGGGTVAAAVGFEAAFLVVGLSEVLIAVVAVRFLLRLDVPTFGWRQEESPGYRCGIKTTIPPALPG
jgi:predicted MFS family arabinose efflux permease